MNIRITKRIFSAILAIAMLLSLLPAAAFAAETKSVRVFYDQGKGSVFAATGDVMPDVDANMYLAPDGTVSGETVRLYIEPNFGIDWGDRDNGVTTLVPLEPDENKSVYVFGRYDSKTKGRVDEPLVEAGIAVSGAVTYSDGFLTVASDDVTNIELQICFYEIDYLFDTFGGTGDKPVIVEVNWRNGDVTLPELADGDFVAADGRVKVRLPLSAESFTVSWSEDAPVRRVITDDEADGRNELPAPYGDGYTLTLDKLRGDGEPCLFYRLEVEFAEQREDDYCIRLRYDMDGAIVKYRANEDMEYKFVPDGTECTSTASFQIINDLQIDWDQFDQGRTVFIDRDPIENFSLNVYARYDYDLEGRFEGPVVIDGKSVVDGYTFEDGVLTVVPPTRRLIELDFYWTEDSFDLARFRGTEDKPVVVEIHRWGDGEPVIPDYVAEEDAIRTSDAVAFRVDPEEHPTVVIKWNTGTRLNHLAVMMEDEWALYEDPDFDFYELALDQHWDNGEPKDHYNVDLGFDDLEPNLRINDRGVAYTVNGFVEYNGDWRFADGVSVASVTFDAEDERFMGVRIRWFEDGEEKSTTFRPDYGVVNFVNDGNTYELEVVDWFTALDGEYIVDDFGEPVYLDGEQIVPGEKLSFTVGERLNFTSEAPVYYALVAYDSGKRISLGVEDGAFSFLPETEEGFTLYVFRDEEQFEFMSIELFNDYSKYYIAAAELVFDGAFEGDEISFGDEAVASATGMDVAFARIPNEADTVTVNIKPAEGNSVELEYRGEDVTGQIKDGKFVWHIVDGDAHLRVRFYTPEPASYAFIKGTDERYGDGDVLKIEEGATVLVGFRLDPPFEGLIAGWRNDILNDARFTVPDDPVTDDSGVYASITASAPAGTVAVMPYSWYWAEDIFGEGAVGWADAEPVLTHTLTIEVVKPEPKITFTDVKQGAFYEEAVSWAVANGVTAGTSDTTFSPSSDCTRGQVVTFLWRAAGSPEPTKTTHPFTDVKESAFYYKAMLWAVENGVTNGMSDTTFAPGATCTRGQVVTFLWRAKGKPAPVKTKHAFTDVSESGFYYTAMLWAVENGVTNGMSDTTFAPGRTCTRGQVVTFLHRAYK